MARARRVGCKPETAPELSASFPPATVFSVVMQVKVFPDDEAALPGKGACDSLEEVADGAGRARVGVRTSKAPSRWYTPRRTSPRVRRVRERALRPDRTTNSRLNPFRLRRLSRKGHPSGGIVELSQELLPREGRQHRRNLAFGISDEAELPAWSLSSVGPREPVGKSRALHVNADGSAIFALTHNTLFKLDDSGEIVFEQPVPDAQDDSWCMLVSSDDPPSTFTNP